MMIREDVASLASRAFALLLAAWTFVEVCYLPERIVSLTHHLGQLSVLGTPDHWTTYYSVVLAFHVVRMIGLAIVGVWFCQCGPRAHWLFLGLGQTGLSESEQPGTS